MSDDLPDSIERPEPLKPIRVYKDSKDGWVEEHNPQEVDESNLTLRQIAQRYSLNIESSDLIKNSWRGEKSLSEVVRLVLEDKDGEGRVSGAWNKLEKEFKDDPKRSKRVRRLLSSIASAYQFSFSVDLESRSERKKRYQNSIDNLDALIGEADGHVDIKNLMNREVSVIKASPSEVYKSMEKLDGYKRADEGLLGLMDDLVWFDTKTPSYIDTLKELRVELIRSRDNSNVFFGAVNVNEKQYVFSHKKKVMALQTLFCLKLDDWFGRYTSQNCYSVNAVFASALYGPELSEDTLKKTLNRIKGTKNS